MNSINEDELRDSGNERSRRFAVRGIALGLALGLAITAALVLSYELARTFITSSVDQAALTAAEEKASDIGDSQFSFPEQPAVLPEIHFLDSEGRPVSLADFRGRPVLLNIWATWCLPCRKEMPALERLQAQVAPSQLLVLAVSVDQNGPAAAKRFYQELGLKSLAIYVDPTGTMLSQLRAPGLPTTLLINREGQEVGRRIGPAEWDSPQIVALLRERLDLPSTGPQAGDTRK